MRTIIFIAFFILFGGMLSAADKPTPQGPAYNVVIEKKAHRLTVYSDGKEIKKYKISIGRGGMGKKLREGDKLTPEGSYIIDKRNPESSYHLSLHLSYPNPDDIAAAAKAGVPPGSDIMIHGLMNGFGWLGRLQRLADWTLGCIALTNPEIEELWKLLPDGTPVEIKP
ncbi:MAG: L,D-transpeptidase family protein [Elusimicrobia bacterium]|nr:L,D-transpeptidase family protein [Elusimicrobiota bacterium]